MHAPLKPATAPYFPPPPRFTSTSKPRSKFAKASTDGPPKPPQTLRRSRQILLPIILILSFITTILSMIYAYCIAAPHTRLSTEDFAREPTTELDDSMFSKLLRRGSTNPSSDGDSPIPVVMIAYTLATPVATLFYILFELSMTVIRPLVSITRRTHFVFFTCVLVLVAGWTTNNALWIHCEMPAPSLTQSMQMCPPSVRGHFMYGIHELTIAKVVLAWLIVLGLLLHALCILKNLRDIRMYGGEGLGIHHGAVRMVLQMEEGARVQKGLRRDFKRHGVRVAEGY
ncbi:uncharacterized protein HMPREF1541_01079 [Cyphellophora europaea CBS 101466]|uniref:Uncharacterized protein n=1 Tax=Cyphellophora europaea (strain CBS 101466) TaxID=1220924 RepID=W2SE59_CYPE1|nr:uncharacterized protein HMPREF1541_01079 [Cyphellophora europaea CBS 101466]ETN46890.1 hypothetical protein HMPREF1541_01079 [Cyphellophora europaea CBS 101466]